MAARASRPQMRPGHFFSGFRVIPLDDIIAGEAVELRRRHRMKLPDAIVWASARVEHRLLVTRNEKDFPVSDPGCDRRTGSGALGNIGQRQRLRPPRL